MYVCTFESQINITEIIIYLRLGYFLLPFSGLIASNTILLVYFVLYPFSDYSELRLKATIEVIYVLPFDFKWEILETEW